MIIVISNRERCGKLDGQDKPLSFLGKNLASDGNVYARLCKRNSRLELYNEQNKHRLFDKLVNRINNGERALNRPWVLFVHGNNQNTEKNIAKAIDIERLHKVNVIAFSWPSQPYTGKEDAMLRLIKKEAVKNLIREIGGNNIVNLALSKLAEKSEEYLRNYLLARIHAEQSPQDFVQALKAINSMLLKQTGKRVKLSLLSHSLGNYLLQNTVQQHRLPISFHHILLHQADVDAFDHESWAGKLLHRSRKVFITSNQYDYVLMASKFVNRKERLGHSTQYRQCSKCLYLDFTDAPDVSDENEHEFFRLAPHGKHAYTNPVIFSVLGKVLRGESTSLSPRHGLRKKGPNQYRLAQITDPTDGGVVSS